MRFLLSRLAFRWAALAVGLCLLLPSLQGTWAAALAVAAVALSRLCAEVETQARAEDGRDLAGRVKARVGGIDTVLSVLRSLPVPRA